MTGMILPSSFPGCAVDRVIRDPGRLVVIARPRREHGRCPTCGTPSSAVHSRYDRHPADLPSLGRSVTLRLRVRRFYCRHPTCQRRTFADPLPRLLPSRARRTRRLADAQARIGLALGGEAAARLLPHLAMPASPDTLLRLVRRLPLPPPETARIVGVDDWALRERCTYGTLLVDLERRRPMDLLPDRTATTLATWLQRRPGIAVVARDRSTEYARGITLGAPSSVQVADRWHLLLNLRQSVERWLHGAHPRLRRLPVGAEKAPRAGQRDRAFPRSTSEQAAGAASRARWRACYEDVRRRHRAGETLSGIARAKGLALGTVRKYARAPSFPARTAHGPGPSVLDPYLAYLDRRLGEGCENAMMLWRELRGRGYPGGTRQVHRWLAERRTRPACKGRPPVLARAARSRPDEGLSTLPAVRPLAWLLVQPAPSLDARGKAILARVEQDVEGHGDVPLMASARRVLGVLYEDR